MTDISDLHELKPVSVSPQDLLLDPRNPRLSVSSAAFDALDDTELASDEVQNAITEDIGQSRHHLDDLISNIETSGFIKGMGTVIVKRVEGSKKFLVLEGNRRTAAIKQLMLEPKKLSASVFATLNKIDAQEFSYIPNERYTEAEVIDVILGKIHISGALSWGAMEKAQYIYNAYCRELRKRGFGDFEVVGSAMDSVANIFGQPRGSIEKNLRIFRVFRQLKQAGRAPSSDKFSLLELAVKKKPALQAYFECDVHLEFSDLGIDRFSKLVLSSNCAITNPSLFSKFEKILQNGNENDVLDIEGGEASIESVFERLKQRTSNTVVRDRLQAILTQIEETNIAGFTGSVEERMIAEKLIRVVNIKLKAALDVVIDEPNYSPKNVEDLLALPKSKVQDLIRQMLRARPNYTCQEKDVCKFTLKHLSITTRGAPRAQSESLISAEIESLVDLGLVERYSVSKETRLRLLA
jgi:hypothetical protein